jgi:hypothetical protein
MLFAKEITDAGNLQVLCLIITWPKVKHYSHSEGKQPEAKYKYRSVGNMPVLKSTRAYEEEAKERKIGQWYALRIAWSHPS